MIDAAAAWTRWALHAECGEADAALPPGPLPVKALRAWRIAPLVHGALSRRGDARAKELHAEALEVTATNLLRRAALPPVLGAFDAAGVPYVLYKGAATVHAMPRFAALRAVSDTDVLVAPDDMHRAGRVLGELGFDEVRNSEPVSIGWNNERVYIRQRPGPELHIDLHAGLHKRPLFESLGLHMVRSARRVDGLWLPQPELALLAIAVHRLKHGYHADARELVDFRLWLDRLSDAERARLLDLADEHGAAGALWTVWTIADAWFGSSPAEGATLRALGARTGGTAALSRLVALDGPSLAAKPWAGAPFVQLYLPTALATRRAATPLALAALHVALRLADVAVAGPHAVGRLPAPLEAPARAISGAVQRLRASASRAGRL